MTRKLPIPPMHTSSPPNLNIMAQELGPEVFSPRSPPPGYDRIYDSGDSREVTMEDALSNPARRASGQQPIESTLWISVPGTQDWTSPAVESPMQQIQEMRQHRSPVASSTLSYASTSSPSPGVMKHPTILSSPDISAPANSSTRLHPHSPSITEQPRPLDQPMSSSSRTPTSLREPSQPHARRTSTANNIPPRDPKANCLHGNHEMAFQSSQTGIRSAMLCFPCGLLCCWLSRKERCTHCGKTAEEIQIS